MSSSIAAIKVAQKQLGLDDDVYRARLHSITGKTSAKDMTEDERSASLRTSAALASVPPLVARTAGRS